MNASIKQASPPARESKWKGLESLRVGYCYEDPDVTHHIAIRTAAARISKRLRRRLSVRKEIVDGNYVLRVYRTK